MSLAVALNNISNDIIVTNNFTDMLSNLSEYTDSVFKKENNNFINEIVESSEFKNTETINYTKNETNNNINMLLSSVTSWIMGTVSNDGCEAPQCGINEQAQELIAFYNYSNDNVGK